MYKRQRYNFAPSKSPLFAGNNNFVPICKTCTDSYYYQLVDFFSGNEEKAIERVCGIFDWYYDDDAAAASRKVSADRSRIGIYPAKLNLGQTANRGTTYLDNIKQRANDTIDSVEKLNEINGGEKTSSVTKESVQRWGLGYTPEEYEDLNIHYQTLKDGSDADDIVTENLIRDLCSIKIQQRRMLNNNNDDGYVKFTNLYQSTLKSANLAPKGTKDPNANQANESFGLWVKDIEKYSPADYFKDKEIYKDHDSLGDYFNRFLVRPFRNLITGSKDIDQEFNIVQNQNGDDLDVTS